MKPKKKSKYKGIGYRAWYIEKDTFLFPYAISPIPYALIFGITLFCLTVSCVASDYGWNHAYWKETETKETNVGPNDFEVVYLGSSKSSKLGGLRIWGTVYYDNTQIEPKYFEPMESEMTGLMAGLEFKRSGGSIFGLYYHYSGEETKWDSSPHLVDGDAKHHLVGLTFHKPFSVCHFLLNLNGGFDQYGLRLDNDEKLNPKGYQANFYPEFGLNFPLGQMFGVKPYTALHYHYLYHDKITQELGKEDYHGLNNLLGLRLNLVFGGLVSFQGRASWVHEYLSKTPTSLSYFGSMPGQFTPIRCNFEGSTARDLAWLGIGAKLGYGGFRLFADYDLNLNARQTSHTISASLCFGW